MLNLIFRSLSFEVQDIADEIFMPRVTSKTDYIATQEPCGSTNDAKNSE